jgi:flagellar biosynthesis protein FliR
MEIDTHTHIHTHTNSIARLTRVLRIMRTWKIVDQRRISKTARQYGVLLLTVVALVFVSAGVMQIAEVCVCVCMCVCRYGSRLLLLLLLYIYIETCVCGVCVCVCVRVRVLYGTVPPSRFSSSIHHTE